MTRRLLLLGRPECHLCEEFDAGLRAHLAERGDAGRWQVDHADVDTRGEWRMRFGVRIPVLLDEDGEVIAEGRFRGLDFDRLAGQ